ncbi:MAG: sulfite exporter TauE/SafE family protein [Deltaproteobacteria bacterium]|nr:sulfite exporter TauE/SafE family protein [Deltaproteobacteria bacterium]
MTLLIAGLVTFLFTTLLTIAGVGAAFILVPVFVALGVEVHTAMATALLLNAISMATASVRFVRRGLVDWSLAIPLLLVASAMAPLGAWVSQGLARERLLWMFVAFLLFAAVMMLWYEPRPRTAKVGAWGRLTLGSGVGGVGGFLGGLLGVGGGGVIVPALVALGVAPKRASATTSLVVIFSSLAGFVGHASLNGLDTPLLGVTVLGSLGGALVGSWLMTERLQGRQVKLVIGVVLLAVAVKMAWSLATGAT